MKLVLGLDSFGDIPTKENGELATHAEALRLSVDEGVLADQTGVDALALGEHHRSDYAIASPEMVLSAIASKTERIKLASGVTVLSSDDPVRVYQRFATLDAVSSGRAEVILGRGSFTESFPLFGYDLRDYEVLFEEKLELFTRLIKEEAVTWEGTTRAPLVEADVYPKTENGLPVWIGVGGTPQSVIRTARYGLGLMLAVIGGQPERFKPYIELYEQASAEFGNPTRPVGLHSPGFIAETDEEARELLWPAFKLNRDRIGKERGWRPLQRTDFEREIETGSLYVGSPETVARKMADTITALDLGRFDLIYVAGPQKSSARMRAVELYGTKVIPMVRELVAEKAGAKVGV